MAGPRWDCDHAINTPSPSHTLSQICKLRQHASDSQWWSRTCPMPAAPCSRKRGRRGVTLIMRLKANDGSGFCSANPRVGIAQGSTAVNTINDSLTLEGSPSLSPSGNAPPEPSSALDPGASSGRSNSSCTTYRCHDHHNPVLAA